MAWPHPEQTARAPTGRGTAVPLTITDRRERPRRSAHDCGERSRPCPPSAMQLRAHGTHSSAPRHVTHGDPSVVTASRTQPRRYTWVSEPLPRDEGSRSRSEPPRTAATRIDRSGVADESAVSNAAGGGPRRRPACGEDYRTAAAAVRIRQRNPDEGGAMTDFPVARGCHRGARRVPERTDGMTTGVLSMSALRPDHAPPGAGCR